MKEEQGKKTSEVKSEAAVKKVIPAKPAKPTGELSEQELKGVVGGNKYADDFSALKDQIAALDKINGPTIVRSYTGGGLTTKK